MKEDFGFKEIPSLLEKMKTTWKKINSAEPKNIKLDRTDQQTIREAFIAADNYTELHKLRMQAYELFIDKHEWPKDKHQSIYDKKLKEAVEIMGILSDVTRGVRGKKYHPKKDEEIREYYTRFDAFYYKGEDGLYYDDEGNAGKNEEDDKPFWKINEEHRNWFATWIDNIYEKDENLVISILNGVNYLDIRPLLDLCAVKIATKIRLKDPEEISQIFESVTKKNK